MRSIRLVFVSTNALTRSGIAQIVQHSVPPIQVIGTFADFLSASQYLRDEHADVILIDEALPKHTNLAREIRTLWFDHAGVAVVVILRHPTASLVQQLLELGIGGILHKDDDLEDHLVQAVVLGSQHGIHVSPKISHFVEMQRRQAAALGRRTFDVLRLLVNGMEPKEIATHMGVGSNTIYRILRTLRETLNAQNNAHLITLVHQHKLLDDQAVDGG